MNSSDKRLYGIAWRALVKMGVKPGLRILDFGAGVGNYSLPAADLVSGTGKVYALDKDKERLDELMANGSHLPQLVRIDTDGEPNIPLPENTMDMILVFDVCLDEPTPYIREFLRVLTSKGILAVYLPVERGRDQARVEEFVTEIRNVDFKLVGEVEQDMVHWDLVEEATVYLFQPFAR